MKLYVYTCILLFYIIAITLAGIIFLSVSLCVLCFRKTKLSSEKDDQVAAMQETKAFWVLSIIYLLLLQIDVQLNRAYSLSSN